MSDAAMKLTGYSNGFKFDAADVTAAPIFADAK